MSDLSRDLPYPELLKYLLAVLDREIGYCGLDTEAGAKAQVARAMVRSASEAVMQKRRCKRQRPRKNASGRPVSAIRPPEQSA